MGTPGAPAVGMRGQREACAGGVSWRPRVVAGEKNPFPGPQAAFAQIWDSIYVKLSTVGSRHASGRNGWFCWWWMLSSEITFIPCLLPPWTVVTLASCFTSLLATGACPAWCSHPCPWLLPPLLWGLGSHPLSALILVVLSAHTASRHEVLCVWQQLVRVSSESGGFSTTHSLGACLLTQHLSPLAVLPCSSCGGHPDLSGASHVSGVFCLRACDCCSLCSELFYHTSVLQSFAYLIL